MKKKRTCAELTVGKFTQKPVCLINVTSWLPFTHVYYSAGSPGAHSLVYDGLEEVLLGVNVLPSNCEY